jgi:hypothetical protein
MKKFTQPPLVILLDVLFIFLFVSILEKPPKIEYKIPQDRLFDGAYIMSSDSSGKHKVYDSKTHSFTNKFVFPNSQHGFYFALPCEKQQECQDAKRITHDELNIVITGSTYDDISRLTFIGCNIDASQCSNIVFPINKKGKIDKDKLLEYNPFYGEIEGFLRSKF